MILISVKQLLGTSLSFGAGASLGQSHYPTILDKIRQEQTTNSDGLVVFDYTNVEDVTASYVKATLLALHRCGRLAAGSLSAEEALTSHNHPVSLEIFVVVTGANDDVKACINDVFAANSLAVLAGNALVNGCLQSAELLGVIESKAFQTLQLAAKLEEVTAALLSQTQVTENITITAWNNRLADLHRQLLLRRQTNGRQHTYHSLVKGNIYHGKILSSK